MSRRRRTNSLRAFEFLANPAAILLLGWAWLKAPTDAFAVIAGGALAYFLFFMIRVCNAINKDGTFCGNDAHGLLGGCRSLKRHRIQARWRFVPIRWRPQGVQRAFGVQRPTRTVTQQLSPGLTASATGSGGASAADAVDLIAMVEVLLAAGSFIIGLIQL